MNSTKTNPPVQAKKAASKPSLRILNVAFDVSSETLNWSTELGRYSINDQCLNDSRDIRKTLGRIMNEASQYDYHVSDIRIICESTGIYHRRLLQLASSLGMRTNLVHGEAVAKFRAIQFADHGKTDKRDPQAALTVAKVGRLIKHRQLDQSYAHLRELHRLVLRCEARIKVAKCELHADLRNLFADLRLDKSVLYGPTGRALIEVFAGNPHAILAAGFKVFCNKIKARSKYTKRATLERIWKAAEASVLGCDADLVAGLAEIQARAVQQLYAEITEHSGQQRQLEAACGRRSACSPPLSSSPC